MMNLTEFVELICMCTQVYVHVDKYRQHTSVSAINMRQYVHPDHVFVEVHVMIFLIPK